MSISTALDGAQPDEALYFTPPAQLHKIDLTEDPEQRFRRTAEEATAILGESASQAEREHIAVLQEHMLASLVDEGAIYVAQALARSEVHTDQLCTAQFTIIVRDIAIPDDQPLSVVANGLKEPGEPRELATVSYPAGEAIIMGEELEIRPSVAASGEPNPTPYRMRQAQVLFPFPDRQRMAIVGVNSTHFDDWDHFVRMLNDIASSLSFTPPSNAGVSARLDALG